MRSVTTLLLLTLTLTLTLFTLTTTALKAPTSYCKCICFTNSTIIPLNSPPDTSSSSPDHKAHLRLHLRDDESSSESDTDTADPSAGGKKHHTLTCNDCNRAFCLGYNLPICKDAKEEDVFATCFQRDSLKDRTIVTLFLLSTASLLFWALIKPYVVTPSTSDLVQKYGGRVGLGGGEGDALPGPRIGAGGSGSGSRSTSTSGGARSGFGRDAGSSERPGNAAGGRRSISRQGGLNS